jgi:hypothetical protein
MAPIKWCYEFAAPSKKNLKRPINFVILVAPLNSAKDSGAPLHLVPILLKNKLKGPTWDL